MLSAVVLVVAPCLTPGIGRGFDAGAGDLGGIGRRDGDFEMTGILVGIVTCCLRGEKSSNGRLLILLKHCLESVGLVVPP